MDLIPSAPTDPAVPLLDNEVAIFAGVKLDDGTWEGPLGVFGFQTITMQETRSGITLDVEGPRGPVPPRDPRRLGRPYTISPGQDLALAVQLALRACWPRCPDLQGTRDDDGRRAAVFTEGAGDPWKDLCGLVAAYGMELFFDATGLPVPGTSHAVVDVAPRCRTRTGRDAVLTSIKRSLHRGLELQRRDRHGESTSGAAPVRAAQWDTAGRRSCPRTAQARSTRVRS